MMSVVIDRDYLCTFFVSTGGGDVFFSADVVTRRVRLFVCTVGHFVWLFFEGWLAAPLTSLLPWLVCLVSEGLQSWLGGLASLVWWLGLFLFLLVFDGQFLCQCALLVTRLG